MVSDHEMPDRPEVPKLPRASLLLVVVPVFALLAVLQFGPAPVPAGQGPAALAPALEGGGLPAPPPPAGLDLGRLLGQILAVLVATRVAGHAMRKVGQPHVVGEMLAGILLGPSFFGLLAPDASRALFPPESLQTLNALSQVGMVLYMFLVGTELDTAMLRARGGAALLISHVSIAVPFALGAALALALYGRFAPPSVPFVPFALFLGAAMSVTAFPVLARVLGERGLLRTPLGVLAMSAAAVDDVTAWTILLAITVLVQSAGAPSLPWGGALLGIAGFVAATVLLRRPLRRGIAAAFARSGGITHPQVAILISLALGGAVITESLGVHSLFGAFFVGLMLSSEREVAQALRERVEAPVLVVLLPLYFAFTGLRTRLDLLVAPETWGFVGAVVGVAVLGKLGGSALAARASGLPARDALGLGILMNTRGLMELVILNVGLDLGVLTRELYSIMVVMAFTTTLMTSPLLSWLGVGRSGDKRA